MKVYVVIASYRGLSDDPWDIDKIFDNEDKAKSYVDEKNSVKDRKYSYLYYEHELE